MLSRAYPEFLTVLRADYAAVKGNLQQRRSSSSAIRAFVDALLVLNERGFAMDLEQLIEMAFRPDAPTELRGLQRLMSRPVKQRRIETIEAHLEALPDRSLIAHFKSGQGVQAGAFVTASHVDKALVMSSAAYACACRRRCLLPHPQIPAGMRCTCGRHAEVDRRGVHVQMCQLHRKLTIDTHDGVVRVLQAFMRDAGYKATLEPRYEFLRDPEPQPPSSADTVPQSQSQDHTQSQALSASQSQARRNGYFDVYEGRRLDLMVRGMDARPHGFDVQITNCAQAAFVNFGKEAAQRALATSEKNKIRKYKDLAERACISFTPVVFETQGMFGPQWDSIYNETVCQIAKNKGLSEIQVDRYWSVRFSVALQEGISRQILERVATLSSSSVNRHLQASEDLSLARDQDHTTEAIRDHSHALASFGSPWGLSSFAA